MLRLPVAIKLARPRTWAFIILAYSIGWSLTGSSFSLKHAIGLTVYILLVATVNLINAYTDVEEDRINVPQRAHMVEQIGYKKIPYIVALISVFVLAFSLLVNLVFFGIMLLAWFNAMFYSLKPLRFKTHPILSLLSFSGAVVFPFLGGWVVTESLLHIPTLLIILGYFFLVYGTVKNLPDYYGDKAAGLRTTATVFGTRKKAISVAAVLLLSPYAFLLAFIALNLIGLKFLWFFVLFPIIVLICYRALTAQETGNLEKLHTYGFFYEALVLSLALFLVTDFVIALVVVSTVLGVTFIIQRTRIDSR